MKYGKYLADRLRPEWREFYLDYNSLKDLIKASAQLNGQAEGTAAYSPRPNTPAAEWEHQVADLIKADRLNRWAGGWQEGLWQGGAVQEGL